MATAFDAIPLITSLKFSQDEFARGFTETIVLGAELLDLLPQIPTEGRSYVHEEEGVLSGAEFRNVNEDIDPTYGDDNESYWGTAILSSKFRIDRALGRSGTIEEDRLVRREYRRKAKALTARYNFESVNGTGANKGFKGLKQLVNDGYGTKFENHATGGLLDFDALDLGLAEMEKGEGDCIVCNDNVAVQFTIQARGFTSRPIVDVTTDALGRKVIMYNGIPIKIVRRGTNSSGVVSALLPFTETDNAAAETGGSNSSLFVLALGEDTVTGLLGNGARVEAMPLTASTEGPYSTGWFEIYPGLASFDPHGLLRLTNITQAT